MPKIRRNELPDFGKGEQELKKFFKALPVVVGNMAINFYDDSFDREGFIDKSMQKWKPREDTIGKKRKTRRGLLFQSGALRRGNHFIPGPGPLQITIRNEVPYAQVHNDGSNETVNVPAHTRKGKPVKAYSYRQNIPKRQFIGPSELLDKRIERYFTDSIDKIFNNL